MWKLYDYDLGDFGKTGPAQSDTISIACSDDLYCLKDIVILMWTLVLAPMRLLCSHVPSA